MATPIFPDLPGLSWGCTRSPKWNTLVQTAASGLESRLALQSAPKWEWTLVFDYLRQSPPFLELQQLVGLYNASAGGAFSIFFRDPQDNSTTGEFIATGDGATTVFQLQRNWGGYDEPIYGVDTRAALVYGGYTRPAAVPHVAYVNGTPVVSATFGVETGLLTFPGGAPGAGTTITADFSYFFRVRFEDDELDFNDLWTAVWELQKLRLLQVRT
jgi:uncharacterized protein (TIGR02217 family)